MPAMLLLAIVMLTSLVQSAVYALPPSYNIVEDSPSKQDECKTEFIRHSVGKIQKNNSIYKLSDYSKTVAPAAICLYLKDSISSILPARGDILYLHMLMLF